MRSRRARRNAIAAAALCLGTASCTGPQVSANEGLGEPIVLESAQFFAGPAPGRSSASADGGPGINPQVTDLTVANIAVTPGSQGFTLSGHATTDARAVAIRFSDLGSGYWVTPVGPPDPTSNNLLSWTASAGFARDIEAGFHDLVVSAIDATAQSGTQYDQPLCVDTAVPDNLNACVPKRAAPGAVLSLSWDAPVNLNLTVRDPLGRTLSAQMPAIAVDGGIPSSAADAVGLIDRDSNANCVIDNIDHEDAVWQSAPPHGTYAVWVDLFSACKQPAASFTVSLWLPEDRPDSGSPQLVEQQPPVARGELTAAQASGGAGPGLYVGTFVLQ